MRFKRKVVIPIVALVTAVGVGAAVGGQVFGSSVAPPPKPPWIGQSGAFDRNGLPSRVAVGLPESMVESGSGGLGYVDSTDLFPPAGTRRLATKAAFVYASLTSQTPIAWLYQSGWVVPIGTQLGAPGTIANSPVTLAASSPKAVTP